MGPALWRIRARDDCFRRGAALEENIPITDPAFYSSEALCPDALIEHVFRAAPESKEQVPLLKERIAIMRQVGSILCDVRHYTSGPWLIAV